jgi:hypothetical protein
MDQRINDSFHMSVFMFNETRDDLCCMCSVKNSIIHRNANKYTAPKLKTKTENKTWQHKCSGNKVTIDGDLFV